jgi:hypothetical protein
VKLGLSFKHTSRLKKAVFVYHKNMEIETESEEPEPTPESHQEMTVVILGEVAVWVAIWDYYANYNR